MALRGTTIPVKRWWLRLARGLIANDERGLVELGIVLAKHIKRDEPFSHSMLSNFKNARADATDELITALCLEFKRLPSPIFFPRNYEEAVALSATADRYKHLPDDEDPSPGSPAVEAAIVEMKPKKKSVATSTSAKKRSVGRKTGS